MARQMKMRGAAAVRKVTVRKTPQQRARGVFSRSTFCLRVHEYTPVRGARQKKIRRSATFYQ